MRRTHGQVKAIGAQPPRITPRDRLPVPVPPPLHSTLQWEATIVELGHGRYRVHVRKGTLEHGPGDAPGAGFVRWGFDRAHRFALRMVRKLEARDRREVMARTWRISA